MKIKKTIITREIAGQTSLVPFGDALKDTNGMFMLTESGAFIWSVLPECDTEQEIVNKLFDEYEVERSLAETDVKNFLNKLREFDIID